MNGFNRSSADSVGQYDGIADIATLIGRRESTTLQTVDGSTIVPVRLFFQRKQVGVDVALACELLASHSRCRWDTLVLVAGDGDLEPPLQQLLEQSAIRVILVGSQRARSHRLVPWVERSIDLHDIANDVARLAPALAGATGTEQVSA